ncbi:MAG TPA: Smr/MutS family protein [Beijerinckiaceae bacterium]|jgi:DNA-nicking Smr family endonuclease|nr:Smr/MutS family protein [Beijerinckiaceae bacterium]
MKRSSRNAPSPNAPKRNAPDRSASSRPRGRLTEEDLRLWAEVVRSIKPLRGKTAPEASAEAPPARQDQDAAASSAPKRDAISRPRNQERRSNAGPLQPPLATLERRLLQRLRRGRTAPGAVIDLHGLRQEEARRRLLAFLHDCQASGKKTAIVITGKGGPNPALAGERGVLRRAVPLWLAMPDLRALVIGFEEAGAGLGGAGALILRIRAARPG